MMILDHTIIVYSSLSSIILSFFGLFGMKICVHVNLFNFCSYTSIGSIHDTVPNALLSIGNYNNSEIKFKPAYLLPDGRLERAGRIKKLSSLPLSAISNGLKSEDPHRKCMLTATVIAVGDEIL